MAWQDTLREALGIAPRAPAAAPAPAPERLPSRATVSPVSLGGALAGGAAAPRNGARGGTGGRLTRDTGYDTVGFGGGILSPTDAESAWRLGELDTSSLSRETPQRLLEHLADLSPSVSRALYDFLRFFNPGWEATATVPGTADPSQEGQEALDALIDLLDDHYGAADVLWNRLALSAYLRGALLGELVLGADGRTPVDLVVPDPASVRFKRVDGGERGNVWQAGQFQGGEWVAFDRPTVRYVPVDPFPGNPYGRPMASPALFPTLFLMGLLHDLRRVVSQQGYPRLDVEVVLETLRAAMPADAAQDAEGFTAWVQAAITEVQTAYAALQPEDAYVHTDAIKINRPVGAVDASSLGAVDGLLEALDRYVVQALKTMPLLMGTSEGTSEANANRQWEVYAASVKSIQHLAENLLDRLLSLALQAQGIQATATMRFAELRASELLRDEQARRLRNENTAFEYGQGWIDQDEAAMATVGHPPAEEEPRMAPVPAALQEGAPDPSEENPEPGESRLVALQGRRERA